MKTKQECFSNGLAVHFLFEKLIHSRTG